MGFLALVAQVNGQAFDINFTSYADNTCQGDPQMLFNMKGTHTDDTTCRTMYVHQSGTDQVMHQKVTRSCQGSNVTTTEMNCEDSECASCTNPQTETQTTAEYDEEAAKFKTPDVCTVLGGENGKFTIKEGGHPANPCTAGASLVDGATVAHLDYISSVLVIGALHCIRF